MSLSHPARSLVLEWPQPVLQESRPLNLKRRPRYLEISSKKLGEHIQRGRVLPVRNRSTAQLLSREMEILCNDKIYQEALSVAAKLIASEH